MSTELMFALVCALAGIGYGVVSIMSILNKPAGDDEMQRIQGAIQEGASAYLKRQYTAIAVVGVISSRSCSLGNRIRTNPYNTSLAVSS